MLFIERITAKLAIEVQPNFDTSPTTLSIPTGPLISFKFAFPEKSDEEVVRIAKESYKTMGKMVMTSIYLEEITSNGNTVLENEELMLKACENNEKAVIIVSLHLGGFEAGSVMRSIRKFYAVFRKQKNKKLNARKTIICVIVFLAFFIRGAYEQKNNITHLGNVENKNLELAVSDRFDVNGAYVSSIGSLSNEKVLVSYIVKSEDEKKFFKEKFWGGKLLVNANIEDVSEKTNFYSFDYKKYKGNRGIFKRITILKII